METFQNSSADPQPDWAVLLPREAFREVIRVLRGSMPLPDTDGPEEWGRQDRAAMAAVAALRPENAAEGQLAAQFVLAEAWAADCLRLAGERRRETTVAMKCKAQALSFMREAKSAWRLLMKAQAERKALEKDPEAWSRAEWAEHAALGMMREGLAAEEAVEVAAPNPGLFPEPEGEGEDEVARGEVEAGDVSEFGFYLDSAMNSRGARRETESGVRELADQAPVFA